MFPSLCSNASEFHCDSCEKAKHHLTSFRSNPYKPSKPFTIIHSDLWGPSSTSNRTHSKWFITFIDDHTRVSWVYLLKSKTEVYHTFRTFHSMIQTQFQTQIQVLHSENNTEYTNQALSCKTPLQVLHQYYKLPYQENTLPLKVFRSHQQT